MDDDGASFPTAKRARQLSDDGRDHQREKLLDAIKKRIVKAAKKGRYGTEFKCSSEEWYGRCCDELALLRDVKWAMEELRKKGYTVERSDVQGAEEYDVDSEYDESSYTISVTWKE